MRRRPFRRPFRRSGPLRIPPELQYANELMDAGHHTQAAIAFEKISRRADTRHGPRAPIFHLRAGHAYFLSGDAESGMPHLQKGLRSIAAQGKWDALQRFGQRAIDQLNELGFPAQAQEISNYFSETLPENSASTQPKPLQTPTLPTQCPGCGGPVRTDEVSWIDQLTAECIYCGSSIREEK